MDDNQLIHRLTDIFAYKNTYQYQTSSIQPQDMYILEKIFFQREITIKTIARRYDIPPSTLTGIIDRLEAKKYIKRIRTNPDRRTVTLVITDRGKEIVENHLKEDKLFTQNFFNALPQAKRNLFKELLTELLVGLNKESLFHEPPDNQ